MIAGRRQPHRRAGAWALLAACLAGTACAGGPVGGGGGGTVLTVLAASSLAGSFEEIGEQFEASHPGVSVRFSFAGSPALVGQVRAGAPADVLAVADRLPADELSREGLVAPPRAFARNGLAILVAPGNPHRVRGLSDLDRPGLVVVVCSADVPCGSLAVRALARTGVHLRPRSFEVDVKAVVSRVVLGEADAGLVYESDVRAVGSRAAGVRVGPAPELTTTYAIAPVAASPRRSLAGAFVSFVVSPPGQGSLRQAGFRTV